MSFDNGFLTDDLIERMAEHIALRLAATTIVSRPTRILREREVLPLSGLGSASTLKRLVRLGLFPAPVPISEGRVGYREDEVLSWQQERTRERDAKLTARSAANQAREPGTHFEVGDK